MFTLLVLLVAQLISAQLQLDAYVKIIDDNEQAGERGIYRFTVQVQGATLIQTFLPAELTVSSVDICRLYLIQATLDIDTCSYFAETNEIQFQIDPDFDGYIVYDLGYLQNPSYSVFLTGFMIQTKSQSGQVLAQSDPYAVYVQILPNVITQQSLSVNSLQIADKTTYLFQMTVTNKVPQGGFLKVVFPSTQIAVPETPPQSFISIDGGKSWVNAPTTQSNDNFLLISVNIEIKAKQKFQFRMLDINNPNTMAETQSFQLMTMNQDGRLIDQVLDGLTVDCNLPAVLGIESVSVSSRRVGTRTTLTFKIILPTKYSQGGYLLVQLPQTLSIDQAFFQCILLIGFESDSGRCKITEQGGQVQLYDVINQKQLVFAIQGVNNPPNTKVTDTFIIQARDPEHNMIAVSEALPSFGYEPTPGVITSVTSTRKINVVGQLTDVTIGFRTASLMQSGELIRIEIPQSHMELPRSLTCESEDKKVILCTLELKQSSFIVLYALNKAMVRNAAHSIVLKDMKNINWIQSVTDGIQIRSLTSDQLYLIDQLSTTNPVQTMPELVEGAIVDVSLAKETGVVGDGSSFQAALTIQNPVAKGGFLTIEVADETFQEPLNADQLSCLPSICEFTKFQSGYINRITVRNICVNGCSAQTKLTLQISKLRNPRSVKPITNQFTFRTFTPLNQAIDRVTFSQASGLEIEPASLVYVQLLQPLSPEEIKTGGSQTYKLAVRPLNGLQARTGKMVITLPTENQLSPTAQCTAQDEQSLRQLTCQVTDSKLEVSHTNTAFNYAGMTIIVSASGISNPPTTKESSYGQVVTYLSSGSIFYKVDQALQAFTCQANTPNQLVAVTVTRTVSVINQKTDLRICFTPFNPVPQQSIITLVIPEDQAVVGNSITVQNALPLSQEGQTIQVQTILSVKSKSESCFVLLGDIMNPQTTIPPTSSFQVDITTQEKHQIDQLMQDIIATPFLSAGPFTSISLQSSNNVIGLATDLTFQIQLSAQLNANGFIFVAFPTSVFYVSQQLKCFIGLVEQSCQQVTTKTDQFGEYHISLKLQTSQFYQKGSTIQLRISNVLNKFNDQAVTVQFTVQTQEQQLYTVNAGQVTAQLEYKPNQAGWFTVQRSELQVQKATQVSMMVNLQTRVKAGSKLKIALPQFWLTNPQSIKVQIQSKLVSFQLQTVGTVSMLECQLPALSDLSKIQVKVDGFKNRYSLDSSDEWISLETVTADNYRIDVLAQQPFSDSLVAGSVTVASVTLSNAEVGQQTMLSVSLVPEGLIRQGDVITVLNTELSLIQNGQQVIKVNDERQTLVKSEDPLLGQFWAGFSFVVGQQQLTQFTIEVSGVKNLLSIKPLNFDFSIEVRSSTGGLIFDGKTKITNQNLLTPTWFNQVKLIRQSAVIETETQLQITFQVTTTEIMPKSQLQLVIPYTELVVADQSQSGWCSVEQPYTCSMQAQEQLQSVRLVVQNVCQYGCYVGQDVAITILKGFRNPAQAQWSQLSSQIMLLNQENLIASQTKEIRVRPDLQSADLLISKLEFRQEGGLVAGQKTQLRLSMVIDQDAVAAETMSISLPENYYIFEEDCECLLAGRKVTCAVSQRSKLIQGQPQYALQITIQGVGSRILGKKETVVQIMNLRNSDQPTDFKGDQASMLLISKSNLILCSGQVQIKTVLEMPTIDAVQLKRQSVVPGENKVTYLLTFVSPTFFRADGYLLVKIPLEQAIADSRSLWCRETKTSFSISCKLQKSDNPLMQVIMVPSWCRYATPSRSTMCEPGTELRLQLTFSNPLQIQTTGMNATVEMLSTEGQVAISQGFIAQPQLSGLLIQDVTLRRVTNTLGSQDETLTLWIGSISAAIVTDTDLIVTLPVGIVKKQNKSACLRVADGDQKIECSFAETQGWITSITFTKACNQRQNCQQGRTLELKVTGLQNPTSNQLNVTTQGLVSLKSGLRELGFAQFDPILSLLSPAQSATISAQADNCKTLTDCQIQFSLKTVNPLKVNDYLVVSSDLRFTSQSCTSQTQFQCTIDTTNQLRLVAMKDIPFNQIDFTVAQVMMPESSKSYGGFQATSYELINKRAVMMENFTGGSITVEQSQFRQVTAKRINTELDERTELRVFIRTRQNGSGSKLVIQVPQSTQIVENGSCSTLRGTKVECVIGEKQTVTALKFDTWCKDPDSGCVLVLQNTKNPDAMSTVAPLPLTLTLQKTLVDQDYVVHQSQVYVTPSIVIDELMITEVMFTPSRQIVGQLIGFSFSLDANKLGNYLIITFREGQYQPLISRSQKIAVFMGLQNQVDIIDMQVTAQYELEQIVLMGPLTTGKHRVLIEGLFAPKFVSPTFSNSSILIQYVNQQQQEISSKEFTIPIILQPSILKPVTVYANGPFISQQTKLTVSFGYEPQMIDGATVLLAMPPDYSVRRGGLLCSDLQTEVDLKCTLIGRNQIQIQYDGKPKPYGGQSFALQGVINPATIGSRVFELSVLNKGFMQAIGTFELATSNQTQCVASRQPGCDTCASSGVCVTCEPGFVLNGDKCSELCDAGMFEVDGRCYQCQSDCLLCQRQDSCSLCPQGKVMLNGVCVGKCPFSYLYNEQLNICNHDSSQSLLDCMRDTKFLKTENLLCTAAPQTQCSDSKCQRCSFVPGFCDKCSPGTVQHDGQCLSQCPSGYFMHDFQCFKCSPKCKECASNANRCLSCKRELKLVQGYDICELHCPIGTYEKWGQCVQCDDKCNSCGPSGRCETCWRDFKTQQSLYYYEGDCIEQCPPNTQTLQETHECVEVQRQGVLHWSLPIAFGSLFCVLFLTKLSRCFGRKHDRQLWVASALLNLVDFVSRIVLVVTLWPTKEIGGFCVAGIYTLGVSITGIYESQLVNIKNRPSRYGVLSSATGPYTTRLLLGNFFGKNLQVTKQRGLPYEEFEKCCLMQTLLTTLSLVNCIVVCCKFGQYELQYGVAVCGCIFASVQLLLQLLIQFCDKQVGLGVAPSGKKD